MNITVFLNGTKTILEAPAQDSLMKVLRNNKCSTVKCGCNGGFCGSCSVLLDNIPVASCKIPVGIINNADVVTLDYFERTQEYTIICQGFELAGIKLCGYCNAGKIFTAYQLLNLNKTPSREEILDQIKNLAPCCTDINTLELGIRLAIEIKNKGYEKVKQQMEKRKR